MHDFYSASAQLQWNLCENPSFAMSKVSIQKNFRPRPRKSRKVGPQKQILLPQRKFVLKKLDFSGISGKIGPWKKVKFV